MSSSLSLPVIDISPLREIDPKSSEDIKKQKVKDIAKQIEAACIEHGFFYVVNHGIDKTVTENLFNSSTAFFECGDKQVKRDVSSLNSPLFRGYLSTEDGMHNCKPLNTQSTDGNGESCPAGREKDATVVDQKESFTIGAGDSSCGQTIKPDEKSMEERASKSPMHGPNQWPKPSSLPEFRSHVERYWEALHVLTIIVARGLALSLNLDSEFFVQYLKDPVAQLVLLRYPPPPRRLSGAQPSFAQDCTQCEEKKDGESEVIPKYTTDKEDRKNHPGCGEHTDCGFLTILAQNSVPGLEVLHADSKQWIAAPPIDGAFLINLGDMAARWTNDRYRSTWHRVYNSSDRVRYSAAYFCNCDFHAPVECILTEEEEKVSSEVDTTQKRSHEGDIVQRNLNGKRYEKTTAGVYIMEKLGLMRPTS